MFGENYDRLRLMKAMAFQSEIETLYGKQVIVNNIKTLISIIRLYHFLRTIKIDT